MFLLSCFIIRAWFVLDRFFVVFNENSGCQLFFNMYLEDMIFSFTEERSVLTHILHITWYRMRVFGSRIDRNRLRETQRENRCFFDTGGYFSYSIVPTKNILFLFRTAIVFLVGYHTDRNFVAILLISCLILRLLM